MPQSKNSKRTKKANAARRKRGDLKLDSKHSMKQMGNEHDERDLASPGPALQPCELFVGVELFSPRALSPVEPIDKDDYDWALSPPPAPCAQASELRSI
eukprot:1830760-Prymnesium_polylepis.1